MKKLYYIVKLIVTSLVLIVSALVIIKRGQNAHA